MENDKSVEQIALLTRQSAQIQTAGNTPFVIVPPGCTLNDLSKFEDNYRQERPLRTKGTAVVFDADSFCAYYRLFSDQNSRVFADGNLGKFVAVLDYHESAMGADAPVKPRWGDHRVDLTLQESEEWKRWTAHNSRSMPQAAFGEFIEDNATDITSPDAATMLEVARDLRAKTEVDFGSAMRVANGSVQFKFSENVKGSFGKNNLEVPEKFFITIPVYVGTQRIALEASLRYKLHDSKLTFAYKLMRADAFQREAFALTSTKIAESLETILINGRPAGA